MIETSMITSLIAQYGDHGWSCQRILLTDAEFDTLKDELRIRVGLEIVHRSTVDAVWFSRVNGDKTSWEIRKLAGSPFALVRFVPNDASIEIREEILSSAEKEIANAPRPASN